MDHNGFPYGAASCLKVLTEILRKKEGMSVCYTHSPTAYQTPDAFFSDLLSDLLDLQHKIDKDSK